ncbi:MAG: deoxyribonuclease V [Cognaticolwellia sp.]|jgi:deoxyribonuclease V
MTPLSPTDITIIEQQQKHLASKVITDNNFEQINTVAGVDVAYNETTGQVVGAISVLDATTLQVVESQTAIEAVSFPYIPGLFSFRELPPLLSAFNKLTIKPDLIVCDGQGIAHPRRFGLACHLGVTLNIPTIGCGKSKLLGDFAPVAEPRGSISELLDDQVLIGNVLRTQDKIKPLFVSIGHRVNLTTATQWVLKLAANYRLPETTRQADQLVNKTLKLL